MPSKNTQEIESFIAQYYNTLIKTPTSLSNFFTEDACLSISQETGHAKVHYRDHERVIRDTHRKEISKILIVSFDHHEISEANIILIIGQICYEDNSIVRFVENLFVDISNKITSSIIKFLNEEVVYGREEKKTGGNFVNGLVFNIKKCLCVKNGARLQYRDVIDVFGKYGKIIGYERKRGTGNNDGDAFIEFDSHEAIEYVKTDILALKEKGIEFDVDKKYYRGDAITLERKKY
ncbi:hypothetical protein COBT_001052 [Conglomerata obtusa]